ncbi:glycerophosphodiester phosphodiesterase family protein [Pedobacter duraquae]|uniref:Glycerophosphoryl diester phosphodiesterase n=1 Tax=Pedobacter duraquae TaxID=425511 RepID=A0A4R6IKF1_9SPHI|nr:glycerophosphodiester phosphodiesterase family protein [Pedobacter duraquae]TDO22554.1 glycerophosphoryl diester phosphodiesterase [Pedobacter duraquae]
MKLTTTMFLGAVCFATTVSAQKIDLQAHRGGRGLMPENTIPAMISAINLGVKTLEMDLAISKDGLVVVSHDSYMSSDFMRKPDGSDISKAEEKGLLIYGMDYSMVKSYDAGTKVHPQFAAQKKMKTYRPLFSELIDSVETYIKKHKLKPVNYNVEIKSSPDGDGTAHPVPEIFVEKVMQVINKKKIGKRVVIQSFDKRPLQVLHAKYPNQELSFLIMNRDNFETNIKNLGFTPQYLSPYFSLITPEMVKQAHDQKVKILPWTVNNAEDFKKMEVLGVDGVITDFPDLGVAAYGKYQ